MGTPTGRRPGPSDPHPVLMPIDGPRVESWRRTGRDETGPAAARYAALAHLGLTTGEGQTPADAGAEVSPLLSWCGVGGRRLRASGAATGSETLAENVVRRCVTNEPLGDRLLAEWVAAICEHAVSDVEVGIWLAVLCHRRLAEDDLVALTSRVAASGRGYDYREPGRVTVRRYPTGGISEKLALILPTLLLRAAREVPIRSPFLVARTLAHTGGTWDKLSAIPGFVFPGPGAETQATLARVNVAMVASIGDLAPADRIMYSLRSVTDTVQSTDLIVSSIVAKLRAAQADRNIIDVRFGPHSFLPDEPIARRHARLMEQVAARLGVDLTSVFREDRRPDGSAIGNALEVAEATAVLGLSTTHGWDLERITHQRHVAADMLAAMLGQDFPDPSWSTWAADLMASGDLTDDYTTLMTSHRVQPTTVAALLDDPFRGLHIQTPHPVIAHDAGDVASVDYTALGRLVNTQLARQRLVVSDRADDSHSGARPEQFDTGIVLHVGATDAVETGQTIMTVHCDAVEDAIMDRARSAVHINARNR